MHGRRLRVPTAIEKATITGVDSSNHTITVRSEITQTAIPNVLIMHPYGNPAEGQGIFALPELGSHCYIAHTEGLPVMLGCVMPKAKQEGRRGGREGMNPGDIQLSASGGSFVTIKKGGVLEIGSRAMSRSLYIPTSNLIHHIFDNILMESSAGVLKWGKTSVEDGENNNSRALLSFNFNRFAGDDESAVGIQMGGIDASLEAQHISQDALLLSVNIGNGSYLLQFDKSGNSYRKQKGDTEWQMNGAVWLEFEKEIHIETRDQVNVIIEKFLHLLTKTAEIFLQAATKILLKAGDKVVIDSNVIKLGSDGAKEYLLMAGPTLKWLAEHSHQGAGAVNMEDQLKLNGLTAKKIKVE